MKTKITFFFLVLFIISSSSSLSGQKSKFSGDWKLNTEKTVLTDNQLVLSKVSIKLLSDSLLTVRVYENSNGEEYPFDEKLTLDGKPCKIYIYDMPRSTKATRSESEGSITIESVTTFYGNNGEEDLLAKELWKVDNEGKTLTIEYTNKVAGNEYKGTSYYNRVK